MTKMKVFNIFARFITNVIYIFHYNIIFIISIYKQKHDLRKKERAKQANRFFNFFPVLFIISSYYDFKKRIPN